MIYASYLLKKIEKKDDIVSYNLALCFYDMGFSQEAYDEVLLDAPCSSERHVINSREHMAMWSPNRPKRLAMEQFGLLSSALMSVRPGGFILYSTCSLNPGEDEMVVERLLTRRPGQVEEIEVDVARAERRAHGAMILPDSADGLGPMYFCLLRKTT